MGSECVPVPLSTKVAQCVLTTRQARSQWPQFPEGTNTASCWRARRSYLNSRYSALSGRNSSSHKCQSISLPRMETSQGYMRFHSLRPSTSCHSSQWRCRHWTPQGERKFMEWGPHSKLEQSSCTKTAWWGSKGNMNHWQPSDPAAANKQ